MNRKERRAAQKRGRGTRPYSSPVEPAKPAGATAHLFALALRHYQTGQTAEAEGICRNILAMDANHIDTLHLLGVMAQRSGRNDVAINLIGKAIALNDQIPRCHNNIGLAFRAVGSWGNAATHFARAIALGMNNAEVHMNLANALYQSIRSMQSIPDVDKLRDIFVGVLSGPWGRPTHLASIGPSLIKMNSKIEECVQRATNAWPRRLPTQELLGSYGLAAVSGDRLLTFLLETVPVCDIELERFLTGMRFSLLAVAARAVVSNAVEESVLSFYCALGRQCFINEYVFDHTAGELEQARLLREWLVTALETGASVPVLWPVAVAAYFPLHSLPAPGLLLDKSWPDAVTGLLMQQVREPQEERQYRASIPRLTAIDDHVSLLVQQQYEENPYPRWVKAAAVGKPTTIDAYLHDQFPSTTFRDLGKGNGIDILIAGCGTGLHPIEMAQQFSRAKVLAIDLSLTSLCYAIRKTRALGLDNIEYAQADILKLGSLDRRFDVIDASGVLHHLAEPTLGWRVLLSLLRPEGFMRLGLYSELGRRDVVAARSFVAARGYQQTAEDIRRCRQELMTLDDDTLVKSATRTLDFFSISACRDLLFHIQEHRFSFPDIKSFLAENKLRFLGLELGPQVLQQFRAQFSIDGAMADLNLWHVFETQNPLTFAGMYVFWVQKTE